MTRTLILCATIGLCHAATAQVSVTPYVGMNSTRIYDGISYQNGGAFVLGGVELEVARKARQHRDIYMTVATGASYLNNGFYYSTNFAYAALNLYTQRTTDLKMQNIQIPLTLRLHWQPFPLVEDWKIFLGLGIGANTRMKSTLNEKYTQVYLNDDFLAPPTVETYQDSGDLTGNGKKNTLFRRIELGMKYKRLEISYRISRSLTDMYSTGLEEHWRVPHDNSWYIQAHEDAGKIIEKYSELAVGFRFGRSR